MSCTFKYTKYFEFFNIYLNISHYSLLSAFQKKTIIINNILFKVKT